MALKEPPEHVMHALRIMYPSAIDHIDALKAALAEEQRGRALAERILGAMASETYAERLLGRLFALMRKNPEGPLREMMTEAIDPREMVP